MARPSAHPRSPGSGLAAAPRERSRLLGSVNGQVASPFPLLDSKRPAGSLPLRRPPPPGNSSHRRGPWNKRSYLQGPGSRSRPSGRAWSRAPGSAVTPGHICVPAGLQMSRHRPGVAGRRPGPGVGGSSALGTVCSGGRWRGQSHSLVAFRGTCQLTCLVPPHRTPDGVRVSGDLAGAGLQQGFPVDGRSGPGRKPPDTRFC